MLPTVFRLIELGSDGVTVWGSFEPAHSSRVCGYFSRSYNAALLSRMYVVDNYNHWMRFNDFCREVKDETLLQA